MKRDWNNLIKTGPAIAVVGNMNVGKTTLFDAFCGASSFTSNFPGSTISVSVGKAKKIDKLIIDTPGTFSVFSKNEDERVSRDILLSLGTDYKVRGAILVADAKNLKRSIALALEYAEYNLPMLLDINMVDESQSRGIKIDYRKLSTILGIDVLPTVATEGYGIKEVRSRLDSLRIPKQLMKYDQDVEEYIALLEKFLSKDSKRIPIRGIALLLLAGDKSAEDYIVEMFGEGMAFQLKELSELFRKQDPGVFSLLMTSQYNTKADEIVKQVQQEVPPPDSPWIHKFGELCTLPITGIPIAIMMVYIMYLVVGLFGATFLVDTLNGMVFKGLLIPLCQDLIAPIPSDFIREMIIDPDFGILPTGLFLAFGLVLPVLFCFYVFFGVLEDSGYLPRISFLLDRVFRVIGLNGKGVMPLTMGFSCITMAILTTRMLDTEKEKNIATLLLVLGVPCAPLLGVAFIILRDLPLSATFAYFGILFTQILVAGYLAKKLIRGERTPLILEIPAMRVPNPWNIIRKSLLRTVHFIREAVPVFVFASFLVFVFDRAGGLTLLEKSLHPVTNSFMGLPDKSVQVFIKTIIRRENGATELQHLSEAYTNLQLFINLLVMTFLIPCINAILVIFKERGPKMGSFIVIATMCYAIVAGGVINHLCLLMGIHFS